MKQLIRVLAISAVSLVWVAAASADTIITSQANNSSSPGGNGIVVYASGPVSYCGSPTSCTNTGPTSGAAGTYNLGTSVSPWSGPISGSEWVSFDPNTAPGGTHAQGSPNNSQVPNGTYVYTDTFTLAANTTYSVSVQIYADDTTSMLLNGTPEVAAGSGQALHCVTLGPTCTGTAYSQSFMYTTGSSTTDVLTFDVDQMFGIAEGLDFVVDFAPQVPTPEPSSLLLLGTGLIGAAGALRRRLRA